MILVAGDASGAKISSWGDEKGGVHDVVVNFTGADLCAGGLSGAVTGRGGCVGRCLARCGRRR